jgi:pimeloyl-ACP methyl ester carboxylesterase
MAKRRFRFALMACAVLAGSARAEDLFFDSAGVRIHYIVEGKGEPVVLIHGFGANIDVNWGKPGIIRALAASYRVIAMDNRGHGQSDKPHEPDAYGGRMAEDVIRLMDRLQIRKAHIVGYSMGGTIVVTLLGTHPERLRTAVVGGAGWSGGVGEVWKGMIDRMADSIEQGKGLGPLISALAPGGETPVGADQVEAANKLLMSRNDPVALAAVLRTMFAAQPAEERLRANEVPVLAIAGEKDPMRGWAEALGRLAPHVEVVIIPGANHMSAVTDPLFPSSVKAFLGAH